MPAAHKALEQVKAIHPRHPLVRLRVAQLAWRTGNMAGLAALIDLSEEFPQEHELWRELLEAAQAFKRQDLVEKARVALKGYEAK